MQKEIIFSFFFFVFGVFAQHSSAQEIMMPEITAESNYVGAYKVSMGETTSMPPRNLIRVVGYDFEIRVKIIYRTDTVFEDPLFGIVCVMQDGSSIKLLIDPNNVSSYSSREYGYKFPIRMKKEGWVQIFLTKRSDFLLDEDPRVYKNTSNRLSLYLTPQ